MAFPGTYNFTYYKGDTFEFRISPRNADGTVFDLAGYQVTFTVSTARGTAGSSDRRTAYSVISGSDIFCAIRASDSATWPLSVSGQYVYDVEIRNLTSTPYPKVYTLLTGTITVQEQITDIVSPTPPTPPEESGESGESGIDLVINPPTNFQALTVTDTSVTIDWDPPLSGGLPFVAYVPGIVPIPPDIQFDPQTGLPSNVQYGTPVPVASGITQYTFTSLVPGTTYRVGVVATDGTNFSNLFAASLVIVTQTAEESGAGGESGLDSGISGESGESGIAPIVINPPTALTVTGTTSTTIDIDWEAPAAGGDPYVAYVVGIASPLDPNNITVVATIPIASGITNYQYTGLVPSTSYLVGVVATDLTNSSNPADCVTLASTLGA